MRDDPLEQGPVVRDHSFDGRVVEQIRVVFETTDESVAALLEFQQQIEFRCSVLHVELTHRPA